MIAFEKARSYLARKLSPEAFKQVEKEAAEMASAQAPNAPATRGGMTPNEFNRALVSAFHFYEGIKQTRERTRIPFNVGDSIDDAGTWERMEFLSVARYLYANDGLCRGACNDVARYTVGQGLKPKSHASDRKVADSYVDYFNDWAYRADYSRKHHLDQLQFMWQVGEIRDGDIGIALTADSAGETRLQTIRGHRIGTCGENAEGLTDGVRTDDFETPISYRVKSRNGKVRDIPATDFILSYEAEDPDALRGLTLFRAGITTVRDKKDILGFEKVAVKKSSAVAAVLKTKSGTVEADEWNDDEEGDQYEPTKLSIMQMQSGQVPVIADGEDLIWHDSSRPSAAFTGFLAFLVREIALGLGIPVEFIWDPSALGGSNQRFILEKADRRFKERRARFEKQVMNRIWGRVISNGIARGKLKDDPKKFDLSWHGPADLSVDAGRDQAQDREDVKMGLSTEEDHYGIRGMDYRVKRKQVEREADELLEAAMRLSNKHKVTPEFALGLLRQSTPNGFTISAAPASTSKPSEK